MNEEGSTSRNWCLAHFPCEVLSILTSCLGCGDILNLWKSGNARLRALLTLQGSVRQFRLMSSGRRNLVIPAFLYELTHLEHLSIRLLLHEDVDVRGFDLLRLPSSLKSLDFVCEDLVSLFLPSTASESGSNHCIPISSHFSNLESLSLHGNIMAFGELHRILYTPSLTRLRLTTTRIAHINLSDCPMSLTELYVDDIHHRPATESSKFPPNLIRLRSPLYIALHDPLNLPNGLESLDCVVSASQKGTQLPILPETLKTLVLCVNRNIRFSGDVSHYLPPHLTDLNLQYAEEVPSEHFKRFETLPLTRLVLPAGTHLKDELIRYLPRTLLRLDANYQSDLTEALVEHLPPRLTELLISLVNLETTTSVSHLPRSLKRLSMLSCSFHQTEHLSKQLKILKLANAHLVRHNDVAKLPPELKTFSCDMMTEFHPSCLPNHLTYLDIAVDDIKDDEASQYPHQLTFLSLRGGAISDSFLSLLDTPYLTSFSFVSTDMNNLLTDEGLSHLPPNLRQLNLNNRSITGACASLLPRGLTSLTLDHSTLWTDKDVQSLPRPLKELILPECQSFTQECLDYLPPQLLRFYFDGNVNFIQIHNDLTNNPEIWLPQ